MRSLIVLSTFTCATAVLLPSPTGPYSVAMSIARLEDKTRVDPYASADNPHLRKSTPYMTPAVAADYDLLAASLGLPNNTFASFEMNICLPKSKALRQRGCEISKIPAFPLALFSPGGGQSRLLYGHMAVSLASHGYVVATIDHPYDASVVEFPDGTVVRNVNISDDDIPALEQMTLVRAADVSFVIDQLQKSSKLASVFKAHKTAIDFKRVAMFGHSLGGATAATAMLNDTRIRGGVDMDGRFFNPVLATGLDKPFLLLGRPDHAAQDETWPALWQKLHGPRIEVNVANTTHGSFTDFLTLLDTLNLPDAARREVDGMLGSITGHRMDTILNAVLRAFLDMLFRGSVSDLLRRGAADMPEIKIVAADLKEDLN